MAKVKKNAVKAKAKQQTIPYVQVAAFCDRVLEDKDGAVSAIRIVDRFTLVSVPPKPNENELPAIEVTVLVMLKSGDVKGLHPVLLSITTPSGKTGPPLLANAIFEGGEHGVIIKTQMPIPLEGEGLYWGNVQVDNQIIVRMPLKVVFPKTESHKVENGTKAG